MKKLVAIMLVCLLWFGVVGVVHHDQMVKEGDTVFSLVKNPTGPSNSDGDPFWDDDGGTTGT